MEVVIEGEKLLLLSEAAIFWQSKESLLISDLHLGKVSHFRKSGIAVPNAAGRQNLSKLEQLIQSYAPKKVYFLGDLFHSYYNNAWEDFTSFTNKFKNVQFHLVKGNHDILEKDHWKTAGLEIHDQYADVGPFTFVHDPADNNTARFRICGHIHPCVYVEGQGKQRLRLACFWKSQKQLILPSFGSFTGMHRVKPKKGDDIFLIVDGEVIQKKV